MTQALRGIDSVTGAYNDAAVTDKNVHTANYVWDTNSLAWVRQTASAGGPGSDVNVLNFPASQVVTDGGGSLTIDGTVSVSGSVATTGPLTDTQLRATAVPVSGTFFQATQPVSLASVPSHPVTNAGTFAVQVTSTPTTTVQATDLDIRNLSSAQDSVLSVPAGNATSSVTSVAASATSVTLKASNASRKGLAVNNDSSAILYLKLGATASTTSYTVKMAAESYYEVPFAYTGVVDGIWASATGNARVTEIT